MERQTFILLQTKHYRHFLKLYLKNSEGKTDQRIVTFTTEHKVNEKDRTKNARKVNAEFSTSDENIIDALYRDTGYGKVFVHKDDPEGKRNKEAFKVTPVDAERIALGNLFEAAGLEFDAKKSVEVLNKEYRIHISATAGVKIGASTATEIIHKPIDILKQFGDAVDAGRKVYEEKYGESFPEFERKEDMYAFIDALADPNFDAKEYIAEKQGDSKDEGSDDLPDTAEELGRVYYQTFGKNVANPKKNDVQWIKKQIKEYQG